MTEQSPFSVTSGVGPRSKSAIVAVAFATVAAMWTVAYIGRLPFVAIHTAALLPLLVVCLAAGGYALGRLTHTRLSGALGMGLVVAGVNLMVLMSVITSDAPNAAANEIVPSKLIWVPGSTLGTLAAVVVGFLLGRLRNGRDHQPPAVNWTCVLAIVTAAITFVLIIAGGLVTGNRAGLAVVDWPNSFGWNMFLYPLSRMSGDIYYEHAHRLLGTLVGLTTLVLTVHLWLARRGQRWIRPLAVAALILVIIQGVLGGLRVTGYFTLSTEESAVAPSIWLAVVHGVVGQVFLGLLVLLAAMATDRWRRGKRPQPHPSVGADRTLGVVVVVAFISQLTLGALVRHLHLLLPQDAKSVATNTESLYMTMLILHILAAGVVTFLAIAQGLRLMAIYRERPLLQGLGRWMSRLVLTQLGLGILALVAIYWLGRDMLLLDALITTAHQTVGAALLVLAVLIAAWVRRMYVPAPLAEIVPTHRATVGG